MPYTIDPQVMERMLKNCETLCRIPGVSGQERLVREAILEMVAPYVQETRVTPLGNLLVFQKGKRPAAHRLMLDAHTDEVGFTVTAVEDKGYLRVAPVGGIDPRVALGKRVLVGEKLLPGVFGAKPIHLQSPEEKERVVPFEEMRVDIGAGSREEALAYVRPGDPVVFDSAFRRFGDGFLKSKALDDRAGCALLVELIQSGQLPYDCWFSFSVQEESGGAGAKTAAFAIDPEYAVAVECTTAADVGGVEKDRQVCRCRKGAVLSLMDNGTIYPLPLVRSAMELAQSRGIPAQLKEGVFGGNNARYLHTNRGGVQCLAVSLPGRYIHSGASVIHQEDLYACRELLLGLVEQLAGPKPSAGPKDTDSGSC